MSRHIYHTEAFILSGSNSGEANRFLTIFTKEFGLLGAQATGARHLKSKLRFCLQDYSQSAVSLVRGKDIWRLINAGNMTNIWKSLEFKREERMMIVRVFTLLKRLLHGEERQESIYDLLGDCLEFLAGGPFSKDDLRNLEYVVVIKILYNLGYFARTDEFSRFIDATKINHSLLREMDTCHEKVLFEINQSLRESHL
jgi:DNA repair protein RecO (recombination protein O)